MRKILLVSTLLLLLTMSVSAQQMIIGTITSRSTGQTLPGVSVQVLGTSSGTVTDAKGNYTLRVSNQNSKIQFASIGFITQTVAASKNRIDVIMDDDQKQLSEVTVIGYGTQKSSHITGAIAKIKNTDFDERPLSKIDDAMEGKLAGVQVQEISGSPGKALSVKVRGTSSISNSSQPIYVVDGYPMSSGLDNINPNDIESIEVLKDAASAAIYGSRGSSGVVLVTTKTGKGKPVLQLNSYYGIQERFSKTDVLNRDEYIDFAVNERNNSWILQGGSASDPNSKRSSSSYWIDPLWLTDPTSFPDNDWQELISRKAPVQNYQLSASGASDNVKYYISGTYYDQKGIIFGSDYKRLSFRSNVETKLNSRVNMGLNLSINTISKDDSNGDSNQGPVTNSIRVAPIVGLAQQTQTGGYYSYHAPFILNPVSLATEYTNNTNTKSILANIYTTINIIKNLDFRTSLGADFLNGLNQYFLPDDINRGTGNVGSTATSTRDNYLNENLFTYNLEKSKWSLNAIAGFTYQEDKITTTNLTKTGFPDANITTLNLGTVLSAGGSDSNKWSLLSFLSRANFAWQDKYLLSASIRRDGSSKFGSENRWGWFPAASVGWVISQEDFMKDRTFINQLKLRASYGVAGNNNIGNYAAIGALNSSNYVIGTTQTVASGFAPGSFSNRTLGWEKTSTLDAGLDLSFFKNRIALGFDYYRSDTKDLLLNVQIPAISGFTNAIENIGKLRNSGVEIELNTVNTTGKVKWSTSFNISHNKNTVLALGPDGAPIYGAAAGFTIAKTQIGSPIGSYYLFVQDGVFKDQADFDSHPHYNVQNVGDIKYKDINNDGIINESDRTLVGSNSPTFFWGFQNTVAWNKFDLTVFTDGQWGNKSLNLAIKEEGQSRGNVMGMWRDRWRSPEDPGNGIVPRAAVTANLTTPSTFWLRSAAYYRIRTISLGYSFSDKLLKGIQGISGLRLYTSVDNVFMHDHNDGVPQTGTYLNDNTTPGIDYYSTYPLARTFTFGINAKF